MNEETIECESKCHFHKDVLALSKSVNEGNRCPLFLNCDIMYTSDVVIASRVGLSFRGNVGPLYVDTIGEDEFAFVKTLKNVEFELHVVDII